MSRIIQAALLTGTLLSVTCPGVARADDRLLVEVSTGRQRVYVGQLVHLTMRIWVQPARWGAQVLDATTMLRHLEPIHFGPFTAQRPTRIDEQSRRVGEAERTYYVYEWTTPVVLAQPGPWRYADVEVGIDYPTRTGYEKLEARPAADTLEVLPVPTHDRPANFNGAVGLFAIEVSASPTEVRVGDPITLTIDIYGDGPLDSLPPPMLEADAELNRDFRVPPGPLAGEVIDAERRFVVTLRARNADVHEVPALEYPYFDPDAERFFVARSRAIPLVVQPAVVPTARRDTTSAPEGAALDVVTDEHALLATARPVPLRLVQTLLYAPPTAFVLTWLIVSVRRRYRSRTSRHESATEVVRRRIGALRGTTAEQARALATALNEYCAERLGIPASERDGVHLDELLTAHGVPPKVATKCIAMLNRCDEIAFAGTPSSDAPLLAAEALACIAALEDALL